VCSFAFLRFKSAAVVSSTLAIVGSLWTVEFASFVVSGDTSSVLLLVSPLVLFGAIESLIPEAVVVVNVAVWPTRHSCAHGFQRATGGENNASGCCCCCCCCNTSRGSLSRWELMLRARQYASLLLALWYNFSLLTTATGTEALQAAAAVASGFARASDSGCLLEYSVPLCCRPCQRCTEQHNSVACIQNINTRRCIFLRGTEFVRDSYLSLSANIKHTTIEPSIAFICPTIDQAAATDALLSHWRYQKAQIKYRKEAGTVGRATATTSPTPTSLRPPIVPYWQRKIHPKNKNRIQLSLLLLRMNPLLSRIVPTWTRIPFPLLRKDALIRRQQPQILPNRASLCQPYMIHTNANMVPAAAVPCVKGAESRATKRPKTVAESVQTFGQSGGSCKSREEQEPAEDSGCLEHKQRSNEQQPSFARPDDVATAVPRSTSSSMDGARVQALPRAMLPSFPSLFPACTAEVKASLEFVHTSSIKVCGSNIARCRWVGLSCVCLTSMHNHKNVHDFSFSIENMWMHNSSTNHYC
jgi:hypothetical protein